MDMTWEQKFSAIKALAPGARICMRKPGDWYIDADMMIGDERRSFGVGDFGNGDSPEAAINQHWEKFTDITPPAYVYTGSGETLRRVRWNGFMWQDVRPAVSEAGR